MSPAGVVLSCRYRSLDDIPPIGYTCSLSTTTTAPKSVRLADSAPPPSTTSRISEPRQPQHLLGNSDNSGNSIEYTVFVLGHRPRRVDYNCQLSTISVRRSFLGRPEQGLRCVLRKLQYTHCCTNTTVSRPLYAACIATWPATVDKRIIQRCPFACELAQRGEQWRA